VLNSREQYIKPLPTYLLSHQIWTRHLSSSPSLHASACGLLLSYTWLVRSPLDFHLAQTQQLLPPQITSFPQWKSLVSSFFAHVDPDTLSAVNQRYHFGELRLSRINTIYRTAPRFLFSHFVRGYLYGYNRYIPFFQRNFAWLLVVFAFFSLTLSAMQVGVAASPLNNNGGFQRACYGFVVFSTVLVAFVLVSLGAVFGIMYFFNMVTAIRHARVEQERRKALAEEKRGNGNGDGPDGKDV
jgi:uncharacterized membrane protein